MWAEGIRAILAFQVEGKRADRPEKLSTFWAIYKPDKLFLWASPSLFQNITVPIVWISFFVVVFLFVWFFLTIVCSALENEVFVSSRINVLSHLPALQPQKVWAPKAMTPCLLSLYSHCCCSSIWELAQEGVGVEGLSVMWFNVFSETRGVWYCRGPEALC